MFLESIEISFSILNIRAPYNIFYYTIKTINNITTSYSFQITDKVCISIFTLISDLNTAIAINVQPKL